MGICSSEREEGLWSGAPEVDSVNSVKDCRYDNVGSGGKPDKREI